MDIKACFYKWHQKACGINIHDWSSFPEHHDATGQSIAIVGNAGYLRDTDYGAFIDDHDLVIRMNSFHTVGYEKSVGSKVDIFFSAFGRKVQFNPLCRKARYICSSKPNTFHKEAASELRLFSHRKGKHITIGMKALDKREGYAPDPAYYMGLGKTLSHTPTTGFMAILFVLEHLYDSSSSIFITGFSFFQGNSYYFRDLDHDPIAGHNVSEEKNILSRKLTSSIQNGKVMIDDKMAHYLQS